MSDVIYRQDAINVCNSAIDLWEGQLGVGALVAVRNKISELPSAQPERLTDDDFETIRIHLNAYKEKLCNQRRWEEAEEYQRIIDRFMAFASAQPEIIRCKDCRWKQGSECVRFADVKPFPDDFCSRAELRGGQDDSV